MVEVFLVDETGRVVASGLKEIIEWVRKHASKCSKSPISGRSFCILTGLEYSTVVDTDFKTYVEIPLIEFKHGEYYIRIVQEG